MAPTVVPVRSDGIANASVTGLAGVSVLPVARGRIAALVTAAID